jgi:hypothetical protein
MGCGSVQKSNGCGTSNVRQASSCNSSKGSDRSARDAFSQSMNKACGCDKGGQNNNGLEDLIKQLMAMMQQACGQQGQGQGQGMSNCGVG